MIEEMFQSSAMPAIFDQSFFWNATNNKLENASGIQHLLAQ